MHILDSLCQPGSAKANEDIWGYAGQTLWLMDGATGLTDTPLIPQAQSDPLWLVTGFHDFFIKHAATYQDNILGLTADAIRHMRTQFRQVSTAVDAPAYAKPVATLVMVYIGEKKLHVLTLSDSYLVGTFEGKPAKMVGGDPLHEAVDAHSLAALAEARQAGFTNLADARQHILPIIREGRLKANADDGYPVLGVAEGLEQRLDVKTFAKPTTPLLLMSDGFSRLVDTFHTHTPTQLVAEVVQDGLAPLYTKLRKLEDDDPEALIYPRLKKSDDTTAVLFTA